MEKNPFLAPYRTEKNELLKPNVEDQDSEVWDEKLIQEMDLDVSYQKEYSQAIQYYELKNFKKAGELYYVAGKIVNEEAETWQDISADMDDDNCRKTIINLSSFYYVKAIEFISMSFIALCFYGASRNNPFAMGQLAKCYMKGINIPKDHHKAFHLFTLAAEIGHKSSFYELGKCYFEGLGTEKDRNKAFKWLVLAARNGYENVTASMLEQYYENDWGKTLFIREDHEGELSYILGGYYFKSEKQNWQKALNFLFNAVNLGSVKAMEQLANYYMSGKKSLPEDPLKAISLYSLAAEKGDAFSMNKLGKYYLEGIRVEKNYVEAFKWFECSAKSGNPEALLNLGVCYEYGYGVPQDNVKAINFYMQADEKGIVNGSNKLARCYLEGIGTQRNQLKAIHYFLKVAREFTTVMTDLKELYEKAESEDVKNEIKQIFAISKKESENGNEEAIYFLALCFEFGVGTAKDVFEAMLLYWEACKKGNPKAWYRLKELESKLEQEADDLYMSGCRYRNGVDTIEIQKLATKCFIEAFKKGNAPAMYQLGYMYESGDGLFQDEELAIRCYKMAAEKCYPKAFKKLRDLSVLPPENHQKYVYNKDSLSELRKRVKKEELDVEVLLMILKKKIDDSVK